MLSDRTRFLIAGSTPPARDPKFPPLDSGLIGPNVSPDKLTMRWKSEEFLPPDTHEQLGKDTPRNRLGFKNGTANLDVEDDDLMNEVVGTGSDRSKPAWATGSTYEVIRIIRNRAEFWDCTLLQGQEHIFGRHKATGAPLGMRNEHDIPDSRSAGQTNSATGAYSTRQAAHTCHA